jgi:LacI family transcriptional regulator
MMGARQMLSLPERPTALFCFNDRMAAEAYRAVHEMNLSIPDDVAIVGFDNQKALCEYLNPPMTTLQLPHYEMGQRAVQQLLKIIDEGDKTSPTRTTQEKLTCTLVERASA